MSGKKTTPEPNSPPEAGKETTNNLKRLRVGIGLHTIEVRSNEMANIGSHTQSGTMTTTISCSDCLSNLSHPLWEFIQFWPTQLRQQIWSENSRAHVESNREKECVRSRARSMEMKYSPAKSLVYHISWAAGCRTPTPSQSAAWIVCHSKWHTISVCRWARRIGYMHHSLSRSTSNSIYHKTRNAYRMRMHMCVCVCVRVSAASVAEQWLLLLLLSYRFSCFFITFSFDGVARVSVRQTHTHAMGSVAAAAAHIHY